MNWTAWAILSAFFAGITAILAKLGVAEVDSNLATAIRTTVVLVFTWALFFFATSAHARQLTQLTARNWLFLTLSGLATGLSWICYFHALKLGPASRVAPIDKLSVVFAIILAALILREPVTWHQWLGGLFVVIGAVILAV
ncbi:MAG: EamA family transporter [Verrucomicrobiota bacterium]|nr:EamA family transporter [Verrucomicrobiota bacterium]